MNELSSPTNESLFFFPSHRGRARHGIITRWVMH